jgi:segregation and condensation protein B
LVSTEIKNIVESIIFASEDEIASRQIKEIIDKSGLRISIGEVEESVTLLNDEYKTGNKSFEIIKIAGGYSFATKKEYGRFIGKLFEDKQRKKLSPSALETLAIIAYKQPITRSEMEFIRGVNVDYIVNSLLEKEMITIHGRADSPGRPILYATTKTFLKVLGLNAIEDLPKLKEINEILKDQEIEGITQADIDLFNSFNDDLPEKDSDRSHQLELISSVETENANEGESESKESKHSILIEDYEDKNMVDDSDDDDSDEDGSDDVDSDDDDSDDDDSDDDDSNDDDSDDDDSDDDDSDDDDSDDDDSDDDDSDDDDSDDNDSDDDDSDDDDSDDVTDFVETENESEKDDISKNNFNETEINESENRE